MDKLKMHSSDLTEKNVDLIAELFPTTVTESMDAEGIPQRAIDFDALRQELSSEVVVVEGAQERYQLDWPGKRAAAFAANAPITKTLRPVREESVDFDTTKNLFIEGDNLEALKLLQESYLGKIQAIFIDPPYNTGNDFIYNDSFGVTTREYMERSGQIGTDGERFVTNTESSGRLHSNWLSMIYSRLKLSRNLLRATGVLFVTIGDAESANLRRVLDEIFGEKNFVANIVWQSRTSISDDLEVSPNHNHVLVYSRDRDHLAFWGEPLREDEYTNPDGDPRGPWKLVPLDANKPGGDTHYAVENPETGQSFWPPQGRSWAINPRSMRALMDDGRIKFGLRGDSAPKRKLFLAERNERGDTRTPSSILIDAGTTKSGSEEVARLFGQKGVFDYPKPTALVRRLLSYATLGTKDAIVLDFFAGSGTTAQAVLELNLLDQGTRAFILVQMPETTAPESAAAKLGYATIPAVARQRIRLASDVLASTVDSADVDTGFRSLRIDTTNMVDLQVGPDDLVQASLAGAVGSVKSDRTDEDLLFQVLLDWGLDLSEPITVEGAGDHRVLAVADDALIACFTDEVSPEVVRAIAERHPLRAVFKDAGFASDAARINAEQIFRELSPETDLRTI
ncbi:site-specific DNA-methyltransferase [Plantibacter sp. VKM Ac-2880]|uniref:site-specific DNA-methyltransferase n=1 Tax=Plantibacter sp. VKM Ac-2880 TaxID=2783827 RepID=UPI00351BF287